jgi:hypothetical protein
VKELRYDCDCTNQVKVSLVFKSHSSEHVFSGHIVGGRVSRDASGSAIRLIEKYPKWLHIELARSPVLCCPLGMLEIL